MPVRPPAVAGQFYPDSPDECRELIEQCLADAGQAAPVVSPPAFQPIAGLAPHAGWVCSGAVAAQVISVLAADPAIETFVVFGAAHRPIRFPAAIYDRGAWATPLGQMPIDEPLAARVVQAGPLAPADVDAHQFEHSIEVELPFIQFFATQARLLPVLVSPSPAAAAIGRIVAKAAAELGRKVAFLGSSDLTHYGPRYGFTPRGVGADGLRWAKEINDRKLLELVTSLRADQIVPEAAEHHNACGAGAIAATLGAAQAAGADTGHLLQHTNSHEVLGGRYGEMDDAVGYAAVVLGK